MAWLHVNFHCSSFEIENSPNLVDAENEAVYHETFPAVTGIRYNLSKIK